MTAQLMDPQVKTAEVNCIFDVTPRSQSVAVVILDPLLK